MTDLILFIVWVLQQATEIRRIAKPVIGWTSLFAATEMHRLVRIAGDMRKDQGRIDDGIWVVQRGYVLCCLFCVAMSLWSLIEAVSVFHSVLWAVPTLLVTAWFWGYVLAGTRGLVEQLRERKMWITGQKQIDSLTEE